MCSFQSITQYALVGYCGIKVLVFRSQNKVKGISVREKNVLNS